MSGLDANSIAVFIGFTVILVGGAAWLMGQALGDRWRPIWHVVPYSIMLGLADRFLVYGLFDGELLSPAGFAIDTLVILAIALLAFRLTRVHRMVSQYPWLYERAGLIAWRERR
jgi:branched-chain amino acid transport system ATP-binding protein